MPQISDDVPQNFNLFTYNPRKPSQFDYELELRNKIKKHFDDRLFKKNHDKNKQIKLLGENAQDSRQYSGLNFHNSELISVLNQNYDIGQVQNSPQNQVISSKEFVSTEISSFNHAFQEDLNSKHPSTMILKKPDQKNES